MKYPEKPPTFAVLQDVPSDKIVELLQDEELNKTLIEVDSDYPYWENFKRKVKNLNYPPEVLWSYNRIFRRDKSISKVRICEMPGFAFKYNTTAKVLKYLHNFDMHLGGALEGRSIIPQDEKNRYLISSIMEEAIASSKLEGAATTREEAKEMLRSNRKPKTIDEKMILNNYLTIKRVLEIKDQPLSEDLILELHALVTKDTLEDSNNEGRFRETNKINVIDPITGEIFYTPPSYDKLEELMNGFYRFANHIDDNEFIHPIIKAIVLHFLIGYIHPFVDGNGRTARAIFYWYLMSKGYWLIEYMSISKAIIKAPAQYARAYLHTEYDQNDLTYFIDYNLKSMEIALSSLHKYIRRKQEEKDKFFYLIKTQNINERQAEMLRILMVDHNKSFTVQEVESKFGIANETARTDLVGLERIGYMTVKKMGRKLRFFKSDPFDFKVDEAVSH